MRVVHLNAIDTGGAARAALRIHDGLRRFTPAESRFAVAHRSRPREDILELGISQPRGQLENLLHRAALKARNLKRFPRNQRPRTFVSDCRSRMRPVDLQPLLPADVFQLHWIANTPNAFLDWSTCLPWLAEQAPLVWRLADMNPYSGIWHYEPTPDERNPALDQWDAEVHAIKEQALARIPDDRLVIAAPSQWTARRARASRLLGRFDVQLIPNALDLEAFSPLPKDHARDALQIAPGRPVIGFVSENMHDPRKGLPQLLAALRQLDLPTRPLLVTVGAGAVSLENFDLLQLGRLHSDPLLRLFYSALDLFVCPSLQESFGQVVLEALACGTPVVGFDAGGIPDMVRPGQTGWLVPTGNINALAHSLHHALSNPQSLHQYSLNARQLAESEYGAKRQAQRYHKLYQDLITPETKVKVEDGRMKYAH